MRSLRQSWICDLAALLLTACVLTAWPVHAGQSAAAPILTVGDPAPALPKLTWLKGKPVGQFAPGHVYIVDFWATWCGPCIELMPHLSTLANQFPTQLTVIGIDTAEQAYDVEESLRDVKKFIRKQGDRIAYSLAADDFQKPSVFNAWATAAGFEALSCSFLVNQQGKVVWMGYPHRDLARFNDVVARTVSGRFSLAEAKAEYARLRGSEQKLLAAENTRARLLGPVHAALGRRDYRAALEQSNTYLVEAAKALGDLPENEMQVFDIKLRALSHLNPQEALSYARNKMTTELNLYEYRVDKVGIVIAQDDGLSKVLYRFAVECLEQSVPIGIANNATYSALASAYFKMGNVRKAIEAQENAIKAYVEGNDDYKKLNPGDWETGLKNYRATLAKYRSSLD